MLIHMSLKRVVDFHGHLCPDLVIGGKLCEQVQTLLARNGQYPAGVSMVAENCTSALDAIQILLGLTMGNQRLFVVDYGKHNYTVTTREKKGYRLILRHRCFGDEQEFQALAGTIANNQARLEDVIQFQQLLDTRVAALLDLSPETLFQVEEICSGQSPPEAAGVYQTCVQCGQPVLKSHLVHHRGQPYCVPCFRKNTFSCAGYTIH